MVRFRFFLFAFLGVALSSAALAAPPLTDYMLKCMGCHGPDGAAVAGKVPPLQNHVARFLSVDGGREYLVQVPGARHAPLNDKAVADLLNWLVVHFDSAHVPDDFVPYTQSEVKTLRAHRIDDVVATRAALVQAIETRQAD